MPSFGRFLIPFQKHLPLKRSHLLNRFLYRSSLEIFGLTFQPYGLTGRQAKLSSMCNLSVNQSTLRFSTKFFRHIQVIDNNRIIGARMSGLERIPTHIEGLDENMQGGIPQGHICLVAGASGA